MPSCFVQLLIRSEIAAVPYYYLTGLDYTKASGARRVKRTQSFTAAAGSIPSVMLNVVMKKDQLFQFYVHLLFRSRSQNTALRWCHSLSELAPHFVSLMEPVAAITDLTQAQPEPIRLLALGVSMSAGGGCHIDLDYRWR